MGSLIDGFTRSPWEKPTRRPSAGGGGGAKREPRKGGVDRSTRFGRWCWRWRLHMAAAVPATVWAVWRVVVTLTQPNVTAWWAWWGRASVSQVQDYVPVAEPTWVRDDLWWHTPVQTLAWGLVIVLGALWLVCLPTGRWGRVARREASWRAARRMEHTWDAAVQSLELVSKRKVLRDRVPRLEGCRVAVWGGYEARLRIPKHFDIEKITDDAAMDRMLRRELDLGGTQGTCEQLVWKTPNENEAKYRDVEIVYKGLPEPATLPVDLSPAPDDSTLRLGITPQGWKAWDLDKQPFLRLSGASGKGKGVWMKWVICQAARRGWMVVIVDGAGAPEHLRWKLPNVRHYQLDLEHPDQALAQFARYLVQIQRLAKLRSKLCTDNGTEDWKSLSAKTKRKHPRVLVIFDEFTALVGKAPEDEATKELREHLGWLINRMLRLLRKYGVNAVIGDQITYSGTYVGPDGLAQATIIVWCGMPNKVQQNMLSAGTRFPRVRNESGYGLTCVVGDEEATRIVWSLFLPHHIDQVCAEEHAAWDTAAMALAA